MIVRKTTDSDGECFAKAQPYEFPNRCVAMNDGDESKSCGTYACPFYKPYGCEDWVRIEEEDGIYMYEPEEVIARW